MKLFVSLVVLASLAVGLPMPEAGSTPSEAVDFTTVEALAVRKASAEWPGARLGAAIPYLDEQGATVAWMFQFRTDRSTMPEYDEVVAEVLADRARLSSNTDLSRWSSVNACVLVSARGDRSPILSYGHGVSGFYALAARAIERAQDRLGDGLFVSRVYFVFPVEYIEVSNPAGERMVFSQHFERQWDSRSEFAGYVEAKRAELVAEHGDRSEDIARVHRQEWEEALVRDYRSFDAVYVPDHELAPFYDWSYGCTPTAGAMVCGFIDRARSYGRLVDWFWQRYDMVEGQIDWQIPNVQRQNAIRMRTDTTSGGTSITNIGRGVRDVFRTDHDYTCDMVDVQGGVHNDWAWNTITAEIDAGYCMVWSALWEIHSLSCFGYRTPEKDVWVHNTWWRPAAWWHYSGDDWSHVAAPHPGNPDAHNIRLTYPRGDTGYSTIGGGEVLQVGDTVRVTWASEGGYADEVDIEWSIDGGFNWTTLASDQPDNGGYAWYLGDATPACDTVRLRVSQYTGSTLSSADGTMGCFRIIREPIPPVQVAPPNGQQIFDPGIVLEVAEFPAAVDSVEFKVVYGGDTIWTQCDTATTCPLPDTLFEYRRSYKWVVRAHNRFGWGSFGAQWTFWIRFDAVSEGRAPERPVPMLAVATLQQPERGVRFALGQVGSGARLVVFDALGNRVVSFVPGSRDEVYWNCRDRRGRSVPAGLYFVRVENGTDQVTSRFVLVD